MAFEATRLQTLGFVTHKRNMGVKYSPGPLCGATEKCWPCSQENISSNHDDAAARPGLDPSDELSEWETIQVLRTQYVELQPQISTDVHPPSCLKAPFCWESFFFSMSCLSGLHIVFCLQPFRLKDNVFPVYTALSPPCFTSGHL